ncbi:unnamed protein product [Aureobasidium vineae]|uniref:Uncharacterized protein n=1 Tax=Aureobasidium vineae TaxID=2773715 RepID=A0A9N8JNX3_9PEZI|nr:unnamed protein product [Aureobasidium vineae]
MSDIENIPTPASSVQRRPASSGGDASTPHPRPLSLLLPSIPASDVLARTLAIRTDPMNLSQLVLMALQLPNRSIKLDFRTANAIAKIAQHESQKTWPRYPDSRNGSNSQPVPGWMNFSIKREVSERMDDVSRLYLQVQVKEKALGETHAAIDIRMSKMDEMLGLANDSKADITRKNKELDERQEFVEQQTKKLENSQEIFKKQSELLTKLLRQQQESKEKT